MTHRTPFIVAELGADVPALQHDAARPEDVDTEGEDHAADEVRYACMSRPWVRPAVKPDPPKVCIRLSSVPAAGPGRCVVDVRAVSPGVQVGRRFTAAPECRHRGV